MLSEFLITEMNRLGKQDALPLHRQLYEALHRAVLDGKLAAGDRLPSSRDLANDLHFSRNTVVAALNQLSVEGYLGSRVGSGTYVNDNVPRALLGQARRRASGPARPVSGNDDLKIILDSAVGRTRVCRCRPPWEGATTLRTFVRKAEQRTQGGWQRCNRVRPTTESWIIYSISLTTDRTIGATKNLVTICLHRRRRLEKGPDEVT